MEMNDEDYIVNVQLVDLEFSFFDELPEELMIKILSYLSPYSDSKYGRLVNRKWLRLINAIENQSHRLFVESIKKHNIMWKVNKHRSYDITDVLLPGSRAEKPFRRVVQKPNVNVPCPRFSHASVILGKYMYIFCGASSERSSTTFNDLYRFDLSNHEWERVKAEGLLPAPRECCTLVAYKAIPSKHLFKTVPYKGKLVIFAGWCQPPAERIRIGPRFFDDTQIFHVHDSRWQRINVNDNYPSSRAGHSASIICNKMVIFGGSQRNNRLNDVWVFDMDALSWSCPYIRGRRPKERFGQSQFTLNEDKLAIVGGYGGPSELFSDVWILDTKVWHWSPVSVGNQICEPPELWCHSSVMVNGDIIVFSEEKKCKHCSIPLRGYFVPRNEPRVGDTECGCGRKINEDGFHILQNHLQMYVLDCSNLLTTLSCEWLDYKYLSPSPPTRKLFSANVGINEIILFGGLHDSLQESRVDDCAIMVSAKPVS